MAEQTPRGMFVVHVRSDSDVERQLLVGRVEHVMSGEDASFASLEDLLAFIGRYLAHECRAETKGE